MSKCLGHHMSVRQHSKSEHCAPCHIQTASRYDWKIVESDVKPKSNKQIDDVLSLKNTKFAEYLEFIYPRELEIKETTETTTSSCLDCYFYIGNGKLTTRLYDKRDDFNFPIVNFPFLSSNIPSAPEYGVYVSQLICYARACPNYQDFMERGKVLTTKLLSQEYQKTKLVATLKKFCGRHHDLVNPYNVAVFRIVSDVFANDAP